MTVDFSKTVLLMPDGSYVVTTRDPAYPYNVLPADPLWPAVQAWIGEGGKAQPYVPPKAPPVTDEQIDSQVKSEIMADYVGKEIGKPEWTARKQALIAERDAKRSTN